MAGASLRRRPYRVDAQLLTQLPPQLYIVHRHDLPLPRTPKTGSDRTLTHTASRDGSVHLPGTQLTRSRAHTTYY